MKNRAYYENDIASFIRENTDKILGKLLRHHDFALEIEQREAWRLEVENLKKQLSVKYPGRIFLEFSIPRMGKRADAVLLIRDIVFVLEYKVGAKEHNHTAVDQVVDYALDLKNFHEGSHNLYIVPILIATHAEAKPSRSMLWHEDKVAAPLLCNGVDLEKAIKAVLENVATHRRAYNLTNAEQTSIQKAWANSGYKPTPTIVEAARALYQGHTVEEISRSDAGAKNLTHTVNCITEIIEHAKQERTKSICFITGVPGAGKTLAGLNISTSHMADKTVEQAVFLSGNGPLVSVLREALARDEVRRSKHMGSNISKKEAKRKVSAFIQNMHHFRDEGLKTKKPLHGHVVIFDEAQRAWNQKHLERFMVQKRGASQFSSSEPELLMRLMDRREDWCTIVCLVGGGQEINTGEAGLTEWFNALQKGFVHWNIYYPGQLTTKEYNWGEDVKAELIKLNAIEKPALHLAVSIRSFRAEKLAVYVDAIIDAEAEKAAGIAKDLQNYPLVLTRDLDKARHWLRAQARGSERIGLVASSGAIRLKAEGIYVKNKLDPALWFLNGKEDIRASYALEDVATEFDIQGLELDWTGLCWDADLRMQDKLWRYYNFKGCKWQNVTDPYRRRYLANAYRVLLTRARQGMVIFVPKGDDSDHTRPCHFYDQTYAFLRCCGMEELG